MIPFLANALLDRRNDVGSAGASRETLSAQSDPWRPASEFDGLLSIAIRPVAVDAPTRLRLLPSDSGLLLVALDDDVRLRDATGTPLDGNLLSGLRERAQEILVEGRGRLACVLLSPGGMLEILGEAAESACGRIQRLDACLPAPLVAELRDALRRETDPRLQLHATCEWMRRPGRRVGERRSVAAARVLRAVRLVRMAGAPPEVDSLARLLGISRRQLHRDFRRSLGLMPSAFLRVFRLQNALAAIVAGTDLVEVSLTLGFSDQSHMTREILALAGVRPSELQQALGAWASLCVQGDRIVAVPAGAPAHAVGTAWQA